MLSVSRLASYYAEHQFGIELGERLALRHVPVHQGELVGVDGLANTSSSIVRVSLVTRRGSG